ncbi:MAG: pilus assembly protein [Novosphingobium sp.]|nr:pilus assembly protein [Novosphingobium sp.]
MSTLARLRDDSSGAALVEFAIVAPIFLVLMFGVFELGHMAYVQTVLHGAVQDAGRNGGLESGRTNMQSIDDRVLEQVSHIAPHGTIVATRRNYRTFFDVAKPEDFTDANGNGVYDSGECFMDANGSGSWDADRAKSGLGGADDVVVYTATLTYERIVPLWKFLGWDKEVSLSASTTLRNQPFADQDARPETLICP